MQHLSDCIMVQVGTSARLQGAPAFLVPADFKTGVTLTHRYEPEPNGSYRALAKHYDCATPARAGMPSQEEGQAQEERAGRGATHPRPAASPHVFSMAELSDAIAPLLRRHNEQPF